MTGLDQQSGGQVHLLRQGLILSILLHGRLVVFHQAVLQLLPAAVGRQAQPCQLLLQLTGPAHTPQFW